ncbi:MAG: polymerase sigma-70 factor, subfamily [Actinomycetota bacterium]|nr:polymerase sigma-70 factor, subfamily [Actinomycetota bacterium]
MTLLPTPEGRGVRRPVAVDLPALRVLRSLVAAEIRPLCAAPAGAPVPAGPLWSITAPGARSGSGARGTAPGGEDPARMAALVALAQQGDGEAFGLIYDAYVGQVYRYLYYRVGSSAVAEDLTSETFLRALRRIDSFRWRGKDIGAWFVTIARNLVADHVKSSRFRLEVPTGDILDADRCDDGIEDVVVERIQHQELIDGVRRLRPDQQECIVLRFLQGLSVAETAKVMTRSEGAVKQLQLRAVRALAVLLPELAP